MRKLPHVFVAATRATWPTQMTPAPRSCNAELLVSQDLSSTGYSLGLNRIASITTWPEVGKGPNQWFRAKRADHKKRFASLKIPWKACDPKTHSFCQKLLVKRRERCCHDQGFWLCHLSALHQTNPIHDATKPKTRDMSKTAMRPNGLNNTRGHSNTVLGHGNTVFVTVTHSNSLW